MANGWEATELTGKPAEIFTPCSIERSSYGGIHLHGAALQTRRDNAAFTRWFEEFGIACVCPHGQRSWWTDRVCSEFDPRLTAERYVLDRVVPFFDQRWGLKPRSLGIQGISM